MKQIIQRPARLIAGLAMAVSFQAAAGSLPGAPTIGAATAGTDSISVTFTAPTDPGTSPISSYTAICGTISATGPSSPLVVQGLVVGQAYTCTVKATNASGSGAASAASNSATPLPAGAGTEVWSATLQGSGTLAAKIANGDPLMGRKTVALDASGDVLVAGALHNGATNGYDWKVAKILSATGAVSWSRDFHGGFGDDHVYALAVDAAGNVVVVGTAWSATGDSDWKVIKYRGTDGVTLWEQLLGAAGNDAAYAVGIDGNGDAIVAGIAANGANVDWKIVKYAGATGTPIWTRTLNGKVNDKPRSLAIHAASGDVLVVGRLTTDRPYATTVRLAGGDGSVSWQRTYASPTPTTGAPEATAYDVVFNPDGSLVVVVSSLEAPFSNDFTRWLALKYGADGTPIWAKPDEYYTDKMYAMVADGTGGTYVTGAHNFFDDDTYLVRLDVNGNFNWTIQLGSKNGPYDLSPSSIDTGLTVVLDSDGNPLVGGAQKNRTRWAVRRYSTSGTLQWGGEITSADTSLLYALAARGTAAYPFGTWAATAGGLAALHLKRLKNTVEIDTPAQFAFTDGEGEPGTWVVSRPANAAGQPTVITGITIPVAITIANGEYSIGCTGTFTSAPGVITAGQTLCLRNVAAASYGATNITTVTVGGTSATFKTTAKHAVTITVTVTPPLASAVNTISYTTVNVSVSGAAGVPSGRVLLNTTRPVGYNTLGIPLWYTFCGGGAGLTLSGGNASCSTYTIPFPGPDTLTAEYVGDANYQRTSATPIAYNVAQYPLTIAFPVIGERAIGSTFMASVIMNLDATFVPYYNALYPTQVMYASSTPSVCVLETVGGNTVPTQVRMVGRGMCNLSADYAGSTAVAAATTAFTSFVVKNAQTISFAALPNLSYNPAPITLTATGGATGNPVIFASTTPAICATSGVNGATLTMLALGTCTVTADQAGNTDYVASPTVMQSFAITIASQTIVFSVANQPLGSPAFHISATGGGSGSPILFTSQTPTVCAVSRMAGATVTLLAVGTCTLSANQAGSALYTAAPTVTQSFQVTGTGYTLTVSESGAGTVTSAPAGIACGASCSASFTVDQAVTLTATAASGSLFGGWSNCPAPVLNRCTVQMNQARSVAVTFTTASAASAIGITDFNADGKPDLLLSDGAGLFTALRMNGLAAGTTTTFTLASNLVPVGLADFNGDSHPDLLLQRPSTGEVVLAYLVNGALQSQVTLFTLAATEKIQAVADFNGDGKPDVLIRDTATGQARVRFISNTTVTGEQALFAIAPRWRIEGTGDFTASGRPALLFRDTVSGYAFAWRTDFAGGTLSLGVGTQALFTIDPTWEVVQVADWNGDGSPDLVMRNATSGEVLVYYFDGVRPAGFDRITGVNPSNSIVPRPQS